MNHDKVASNVPNAPEWIQHPLPGRDQESPAAAQAGALRKWKVRSLGIFGSYVRGEARKSSDLDLLVEIDDPKMGLLRFIALENYLSDLLGVKVDLVEKQALKPAIGRHVTEEVESI